MKAAPYISKSKFIWGLQCHKLLWFAYNQKDAIPEPDTGTQAIFDQGHDVGALAKQMFPDGIEVGDGVHDLNETIRLTQESLKHRKPLFEAAFSAAGGYCRTDILRPAPKGAWDIIEVKSTTSVKGVHLDDLAFQTWVLTKAGLTIRACHLIHINSDFIRNGAIDPKKFFSMEDVTDQLPDLVNLIESKLGEMFKMIGQRRQPDIKIGPHCGDPYPCPLHDHCWSFLPPHNVFDLYRGGKKGWELLGRDITGLKDIPNAFTLTDNQTIQKRAATKGQPHIDKKAIDSFLARLKHPIAYLDFETINPAVPLFDGVRPYQQIPFQFSLHIVLAPGAKAEHVMFLADGREDPRPEFMTRLEAALPSTGTVVAFNASFEMGRLNECCAVMPKFLPWLKGIEGRVVDLLDPFRSFDYYHPDQHGSGSMKSVLPALTGKGYEDLEIQEGGNASNEFLRVTFGEVADLEQSRVRRALEGYCGRDTEGMIWIVDALRKISPAAREP